MSRLAALVRGDAAQVDFYNVFNASPVLATQNTYSATGTNQWNTVTSLLGARTAKVGVQVSWR